MTDAFILELQRRHGPFPAALEAEVRSVCSSARSRRELVVIVAEMIGRHELA
jgi:hypothetical protein